MIITEFKQPTKYSLTHKRDDNKEESRALKNTAGVSGLGVTALAFVHKLVNFRSGSPVTAIAH